MIENQGSTVERLTRTMLDRIRGGEWPVGSLVPGERVLIEQFGASRIALREAMSVLRAQGVIETIHGRGSVVKRVDASVFGQLYPLMIAMDGEQTFEHVFELRLALESETAHLAAVRRTDAEASEIDRLVEEFAGRVEAPMEDWTATDFGFHMAIARATHNPLFPTVLTGISGFVRYVQTISCSSNPARRRRSLQAHESIAEAIRDRDADRARVEMEAHLRYHAIRVLRSGVLEADTPLQVATDGGSSGVS